MPVPFTILDEEHETTVPATIHGDRVLLSPDAIKQSLGWEIKPQGLCKEERCIPLAGKAGLKSNDQIDLAALASALARPLVIDVAEQMASLGASAGERGTHLHSLAAPDFTLPDLNGKLHSLSDQRGKKVLLVVYASW